MNIRFAVVALWAEDVFAAAHFYQDAVGLNLLLHHAGDRPHFELGEAYLTIVRGHPALPLDPEPRFPVVAFSVPKLEAAIERLRLHGVHLPGGVESGPAGRWVMIRDPAGNLIELLEWTT